MTAAPVLTLAGIRKRYNRRGPWVLDGVDLHLKTGSATAVFGSNGSGKSTLLRAASGLCEPSSGSLTRPSVLAYVPERQPGNIPMTGAEYVKHMGAIRGLDASSVQDRSRAIFDRLGLCPGPNVKFRTLSKGNRQKILLTQALLGSMQLLVLDEPFSSLDRDAHGALVDLLAEQQADGAAILMSAHQGQVLPSGFTRFRLEEGRLRPDTGAPRATSSNLIMHVLLRARDGCCHPDHIRQLEGVLAAQLDEKSRELSLQVREDQTDRVLATSIASGWSVVHVNQIGSSSGWESDL